jgi:hypothetical protein
MLGGRAAEELVFGEVTTGAENDLLQHESLDEQTFNAILRRRVPAPAIDTSHGPTCSGNGAPGSDSSSLWEPNS